MPWFVSFEYPPDTAHGFWRNRAGLSSAAASRDDAITEVLTALEAKGHKNLTLSDTYQYQENDQ